MSWNSNPDQTCFHTCGFFRLPKCQCWQHYREGGWHWGKVRTRCNRNWAAPLQVVPARCLCPQPVQVPPALPTGPELPSFSADTAPAGLSSPGEPGKKQASPQKRQQCDKCWDANKETAEIEDELKHAVEPQRKLTHLFWSHLQAGRVPGGNMD